MREEIAPDGFHQESLGRRRRGGRTLYGGNKFPPAHGDFTSPAADGTGLRGRDTARPARPPIRAVCRRTRRSRPRWTGCFRAPPPGSTTAADSQFASRSAVEASPLHLANPRPALPAARPGPARPHSGRQSGRPLEARVPSSPASRRTPCTPCTPGSILAVPHPQRNATPARVTAPHGRNCCASPRHT